jgi:hypothetical protein
MSTEHPTPHHDDEGAELRGADEPATRARALAASRRALVLQRARRIRRTVVALSVALFVSAFAVIYVQLVAGHDPALSRVSATTALTSDRTSTRKSAGSTGKTGSGTSATTKSSGTSSSGTESSTGSETSNGDESSTGTESSSSEESAGASVSTRAS